MIIGTLKIVIGADTSALNAAQKSTIAFANKMRDVGRSMSLYVTTPILGMGAAILKTAGDFEASMNKVAAVSGATGDQFDALKEKAKELGATTQFTASNAADAMAFLSMAGFDANEILDTIGGTLQLASSAQMDLGRAADIVSNILTSQGMETTELARVNDVLVKAFTSANTNLDQLAEAFKYAGPLTRAANVDFEEAAAALALMGNAGIQASMAGTSLRGAITRMLNPTTEIRDAMAEAGLNFKDAEGKLLPLVDIITMLEPHAENAGLLMKLFGQRAGPAMAGLVSQGADALRDLTGELENSGGTAAEISAVQMEGFNGAMRELRSALEGLAIAIGESGLLEFMTDLVREVSGFLRGLRDTNPEVLKATIALAGVAAAIGPVLLSIGLLSKALTLLVAGTGPIGLLILAATLAYTAWQLWGDQITELFNRVIGFVVEKFDWLLGKITGVTESIAGAWQWLSDTLVGHSIIPDMIDMMIGEFDRGNAAIMSGVDKTAGSIAGSYASAAQQAQGAMQSMASNIKGALGSLFGESKEWAIAQAIINTAQAVTKTLAQYGGTPWGFAAAATTALAGGAQIAAIGSASKGRGSVPSVGAGAAAATAGAGGGSGGSNQTLFIRGLDRGSLFSGESVRDLAERLIEFQRDGGKVVLAGT